MKKYMALFVGSMFTSMAILIFLSYGMYKESYAQQTSPPPIDFFALECDEIKSKVNDLLNSKGSVQKNLIAIKDMIFLMHVYDDKCTTPS